MGYERARPARGLSAASRSCAVTEAVVASGRLPPQRLEVEVVPGGGRVTVVVRFDAPTNVTIVGALVGDLALDAEATMRLER